MTLAMIDVGSGLASALTTSTGRSFFFGRIAADAAAPFGVVTMVASSWPSGLERSPTNVSQVVQITAAGKTAEDASWLLDKVRGYMTDTVLLPLAVSLNVEIGSVVVERPPGAPIEEGNLVSMSEDYRLMIGAR